MIIKKINSANRTLKDCEMMEKSEKELGKRVEKAQNQTAGNTIVLLVLPFELGENRHFKDVSC